MRLWLVLAIAFSAVLPLKSEAQGPERPSLPRAVITSDSLAAPIGGWSILTPQYPRAGDHDVFTQPLVRRAEGVGKTVGLLTGIGLCLLDVIPPSLEYTDQSGRWLGTVPTHEVTEAMGGAIGRTVGLYLAGRSVRGP
jgi:hypothetical protein